MFIGPSGMVLKDLLKRAGISKEELYITNLVKCMLPKYRRPKLDEIKACSYYLDREIEIVKPKLLVPLGYYASKYLLERYGFPTLPQKEFPNICGQLLEAHSKKIFPLPHPATILHKPHLRERVTESYLRLKTLLER